MEVMKRLLKEQSGSALIWTLFIILILFTVSFLVYSAVTVYAKYQCVETELQRAAFVTVDKATVNANVRDLELDVPAVSTKTLLEENLINTGWTQKDGNWVKRDGDKLICTLEDMQIEVVDQLMQIDGAVAIPLLWEIGDIGNVCIPIRIRASILYVN